MQSTCKVYFCQNFIENEYFSTYFLRSSDIKYHENQSSVSPVVCSMRTDEKTDGQTDMTKPIFAFSNSTNKPKRKPKITIHKIHDSDILNFCILRL
jgi:hypothetical protein